MTLKQAHSLGTQTLIALALFPLTLTAHAQSAEAKPAADDQAASESKSVNPCLAERDGPTESRTFYLANVRQQSDANEIMVAMRNMSFCPSVRIYLVASQEAIIMRASADELALAQKIIHDLDRPIKTYRLDYTVTEIDDNKPTGTQHYSMTVTNGQHTNMKEGTKIPVATGSYSDGSSSANGTQTQFTYLDIGMSFDASIAELANGVHLKYKVEQSNLGTPVTISGVTEPVIRQSVLESSTVLTLGKPVMLGSIDVPDSTRHLDIAVVLEEVSNPNR
jgi:type II secretory pathway component GspD/PulD (secretin)